MPDIISLSEPQIFQCDVQEVMKYLKGDYCYFLNSDDLHDPELPLIKSKSQGGTLMLWNKQLDPYIKVPNLSSTAILPIILQLPGLKTSIHVSIYLPTQGKEAEFVSELANLRICLEELTQAYQDPVIYIRGDSNVNPKNKMRFTLFQQFLAKFSLVLTNVEHNTYHHFVGNGMYDSKIDIIAHSIMNHADEFITEIICVNDTPALHSHHDIILSEFTIPTNMTNKANSNLISAPVCTKPRNKTLWSPEGQEEYAKLVGPHLRQAREDWLSATSQSSMSVLLEMTNTIMNKCAATTNQSVTLGGRQESKSVPTPKPIRKAKQQMAKMHKKYKSTKTNPSSDQDKIVISKLAFQKSTKNFKHTVSQVRLQEEIKRSEKLSLIVTENPGQLYSYMKSSRNAKSSKIEHLTVGEKVYTGSAVCDGFYDSMTSLKKCSIEELRSDPNLAGQFFNYDHIMKLCQDKLSLPPVSLEESSKLLSRMKKNVKDFYSVTALHYINAGHKGLLHFHSLINALIADVNNASLEEMNIVHGLILYKGHGKEKTSDRAYRTISTCPFIAKAIDLYIRDLYLDLWTDLQAETQYQGAGSSHELASLLVTEVIQYSLNVTNKPVFMLALDAQSAYDRCLRQILCSEMYRAKVPGAAVSFVNNRLSHRKTVYEWDGTMMGPAEDDTGYEQGGINSSDFYKLNNNEQIDVAQGSELGVDIGSSVTSAVAQADDVLLLSNSLENLRLLLRLTKDYCAKFRVKLEPGKTKLLVFSNKCHDLIVKHSEHLNQLSIDNVPIKFTTEAEHVGVLRSINGNMPNILLRITKHKKSLGAVLSAGLARGHRGNPAAALHVHQLYCTPVLFSGLASLVLTKQEVKIIDSHFQTTLQNIQRLHKHTPRPIIHFLAGSVPGEALLHMRQLCLFSMICHLPDDPLNLHARYILTVSQPSANSWFQQI